MENDLGLQISVVVVLTVLTSPGILLGPSRGVKVRPLRGGIIMGVDARRGLLDEGGPPVD